MQLPARGCATAGQGSSDLWLNITEMAEQATVIRFRATAKEKLSFWLGDKLDELMFLVVSGRAFTLKTNGATRTASQLSQLSFAADVAAASSGRIVHAGSATSEGTITSSDKMSWDTILNVQTQAQEKRLRPIRSGGREYFVMVMHPRQGRDLKKDPTYMTNVGRAGVQGEKNPLFTGAFAVVDGVILYTHNKVFNTSGLSSGSKWGSGGTIDGAQGMFLGASAAGIAMLGNMFMRESDNTDYGNRPGIGVGRKIGMLKPQYKSIYDSNTRQDFGCIAVKTAAAASA